MSILHIDYKRLNKLMKNNNLNDTLEENEKFKHEINSDRNGKNNMYIYNALTNKYMCKNNDIQIYIDISFYSEYIHGDCFDNNIPFEIHCLKKLSWRKRKYYALNCRHKLYIDGKLVDIKDIAKEIETNRKIGMIFICVMAIIFITGMTTMATMCSIDDKNVIRTEDSITIICKKSIDKYYIELGMTGLYYIFNVIFMLLSCIYM